MRPIPEGVTQWHVIRHANLECNIKIEDGVLLIRPFYRDRKEKDHDNGPSTKQVTK